MKCYKCILCQVLYHDPAEEITLVILRCRHCGGELAGPKGYDNTIDKLPVRALVNKNSRAGDELSIKLTRMGDNLANL